MIWQCPSCREALQGVDSGLRCRACNRHYETVGGIPDLRVPGASWIDHEADRDAAQRLLSETKGLSAAEMVRRVFSERPGWEEAQIELRTSQVLAAPGRLRGDIRGWLSPCVDGTGPFLDLGCGPGMLLAAAAAEGRTGIGVDVSLVWLVVAQRLIAEWGGRAVLAAAMGEALPLGDKTVSGVVSLDVIEHVADQGRYLQEIDRVTQPGGRVAISTPNRYSLAPEPHIFVWGVGWLPRSLQKRYVRWRTGKSYDPARLLSSREAARLVRRHTRFRVQTLAAAVPEYEIARFTARRAALARLYNRLVSVAPAQRLLLAVGPFFRIVGDKR